MNIGELDMNKYVLVLPLAVFAFFLGYFSSCLETEHLLVLITGAVAVVVFLLLIFWRKF
jgi:hypothetical protein